ncbi:catechol 2,3-dioxygenase-like lactoylglutathione lyase family enzyme [Kitasatospora sp. SolWspMP-SS2h]|uniref:VOC family protein n=1 Tax=Kitasatospora sp. SolWspMP-SS2h TaxID=1305729 RepID=UPI000DBF90CA|nr:VOC family protein [Kitasatospora sp. SolWspMP-SS2h]RAJ44820.1 catechol 2,3-dioxygenase-like lactoylglutathione lyase family enzyme [Kitasatospora sp. SolWspMP-SS2h]
MATAPPPIRPPAPSQGLSVDGVDHLAFVTWRPRETYEFYTRALGMPLVHAITATGWVTDDYPDFVHFFFDMGRGNRIAFFYYFGLPEEAPPSDLMHRSRHVAFHVETEEELLAWRDRLKAHGVRVTTPLAHELIESIYFDDPNGLQLEITRPLREMSGIDARDAELTLQALIDVTGAPRPSVQAMWQRKAELIRKNLEVPAP